MIVRGIVGTALTILGIIGLARAVYPAECATGGIMPMLFIIYGHLWLSSAIREVDDD